MQHNCELETSSYPNHVLYLRLNIPWPENNFGIKSGQRRSIIAFHVNLE